VGGYVVGQMAGARLRRIPPLRAVRGFAGPIVFPLITRGLAESRLGLDIDLEVAVSELADNWLRAMRPAAG